MSAQTNISGSFGGSPTLEEKLGEVETLERELGIVGVSVRPADGARVTTAECVDGVIGAMRRGSALLLDIENIPLARPAALG